MTLALKLGPEWRRTPAVTRELPLNETVLAVRLLLLLAALEPLACLAAW
jgi:hypothetical protein